MSEKSGKIHLKSVEPIDITVKKHINRLKEMRPNMGELSPKVVVDILMTGITRPEPVENPKDPARQYKKKGCSIKSGCPCTGECEQLVPFTEIDRLRLEHYNSQRKLILESAVRILNN